MKNKKNYLGILLAMVIVFGTAGIAFSQSGSGTLTITDIPSEFNGMYAGFEAYDFRNPNLTIFGAQDIDIASRNHTWARITNGRVSIPVWNVTDRDRIVRYTGSHTFEVGVTIFDSSTRSTASSIANIGFDSISFSNGNAIKSFQDNDDFQRIHREQ